MIGWLFLGPEIRVAIAVVAEVVVGEEVILVEVEWDTHAAKAGVKMEVQNANGADVQLRFQLLQYSYQKVKLT